MSNPIVPRSPLQTLQRNWKTWGIAYLFLLPAILFYAVFKIYPFVGSILLSLTSWDGAQPVRKFVGLQNFQRLFQDEKVWMALSHNLIWIVLGTLVPLVIALGLALLLWDRPRGFTLFRTVYFMPQVLSAVVIGLIWSWMYNPIFGILNKGLEAIGLGHLARGWLGDPTWALYAVLLAFVWGRIGFDFVIFLAGLQHVDMELLDAAKIDGANAGQRLWHVTIPQLTNVMTLVLISGLITGFNVFDLVWTMTEGGPANQSELIATYIYRKAFMENRVGYGAALSLVMTVICLTLSIFFARYRERGEA